METEAWVLVALGLGCFAQGFLVGSGWEHFRTWLAREEEALQHIGCRCKERR